MLKIILRQINKMYFFIHKNMLQINFDFFSLIDYRFTLGIIDTTSFFLNNLKMKIAHKSYNKKIEIQLFTPSKTCWIRASTFSVKEPETLLWIEEFGGGDKILFDIGANVGLFSIYHSLLKNGKSYAFEPSFFNLKQLLRNVNLNNCQDKIVIIPNPLSSVNKIQNYVYSSIEEGGSFSAFGVEYGFDGENLENLISCNVVGHSLDQLISTKLINDTPDLLKIDVDGIEDIILEGAIETLSSKKLKSVLVEVNSDLIEKENNIHKILNNYGFSLRKKYYIPEDKASLSIDGMNAHSDVEKNSGNEIWVR